MKKHEIRYYKYNKERGQCFLIRRCYNEDYAYYRGEKLWYVCFDNGDDGVLGEINMLSLVSNNKIAKKLQIRLEKAKIGTKKQVYYQALQQIANYDDREMEGYVVVDCMRHIAKKALDI